jgi:hypothetical protein
MSEAETQGRTAAQTVAGLNRSAGRLSTYVDTARDVRFGQYHYDDATSSWIKSWGVMPYNMVEVTVHRDQGGSTNGDGPLDLFFAPVIGTQQANLAVMGIGIEGQVMTDAMLSQSRSSSSPSGGSEETAAPEIVTGISPEAFAGSSGLVQVSLVGGERNSSANIFVLTAPEGTDP